MNGAANNAFYSGFFYGAIGINDPVSFCVENIFVVLKSTDLKLYFLLL